uniref:Major facilitator superfamily (MFS) profile domain-containing protein n=1 Tax=Anopheles minimus TaxID=112268 RepID=A0A182W7L4_9DIPT
MVEEQQIVPGRTKFWARENVNQLLAVLRIHIITASYGVTVGWPAPIIPLLRSPDTPLPSGPVTVEEASWIGATLCIGGTIGTILFAFVHTYFGKKVALLLIPVPHIILWTLILIGDNVWYIYWARFCSGLTGGGVVSVVPLYIADIADKKIRGTLGSLTIIFINIGLVFIYTAGNYLPYYVIPKIMLVAPVAYLILLCFLPETPYCLLRKGRLLEAEQSLMFYRNIPDEQHRTVEFTVEFDEMRSFILTESTQSRICWADFTTPEAKRGLFIGVFVMALNQFSGIFAILTYAGTIFQMSGTGIDPNVALVLVAVINICGNVTSFTIIDRVGRKILLLLSASGVGLALAVLGVHSYLLINGYDLRGVEWLPVLALSLTLFLAAIGITNVPFFIVPEVMPPKLRSIGSTISATLLCMFAFVCVKLYPILMETIHIHGTVWISSACAVFDRTTMTSSKGVRNQVFATGVMNLINLSHGAALGWVSPYLPVLMSTEQTPLESGPVTVEQGSWIGSILCLGALFGAFLYGFLVEKIGIKRTLQALVIPHSAFWIITYFATSVHQLYLARFLAGLSGGGIIVVFPLFIADISDKKIRGILGSFLALTGNGGILLMYIIGDVLSYHTVALTMLVFPLIFTVLMCFIPDTPQTCLRMGKSSEAERCFMFYRGIQTSAEKTSAFRQEFDNMEKFIEHNAGKSTRVSLADFSKNLQLPYSLHRNVSLNDLFTESREAKLGIFIGVFLMFINQFCGIFAILTYAASIFAGVGSTLSPNTSAIIMGSIQIVGTLSSFVFVDLAGRKVLLIISTFGTGLGLFLLAVFNWLTLNGSAASWLQDYSWFPIVSLSATVYLFSIGLCSIPFFVLPELLPPKICNAGNTLSMVSITIFSFISLKIFPIMVEMIELYGVLGMYAGISFAGVIVIALIVPETKGKNLITPQMGETVMYSIAYCDLSRCRSVAVWFWRDAVSSILIVDRESIFGNFTNLIALAHGFTLGWVSPSLEYLLSNDTHLTGGPMTVEETSWLGSSLCIGGMIGVILYGSLADRIGKRKALQCIAIPHVAFWLFVIFGTDVIQLCIGRVLAGIAGGGIIRIVPLFVADIADPRIRGMLGSLLPVCFNLGTVLAFILGTLVPFATFPLVVLSLPAIFTLAIIFLPETPACLLRAYRNERAERSLMFYRGVRGHFEKSDIFRNEFQQLKDVVEREKTAPDAALSWKDFATKPARRGLAMGMLLMLLTQCSGTLALITYASSIFELAGSSSAAGQNSVLPASLSSIVLATVQLLGTILSLALVDRIGRKILLIVSCLGVAVGYLTLAGYVQFFLPSVSSGVSQFLPICSLSISILLASVGLLTVPFVVMAEVLPAKIRNIGSTICMTIVALSAFFVLKLFPVLLDTVGLAGTMAGLAMICFTGAIGITLFLPETRGKSLLPTSESENPSGNGTVGSV